MYPTLSKKVNKPGGAPAAFPGTLPQPARGDHDPELELLSPHASHLPPLDSQAEFVFEPEGMQSLEDVVRTPA